MIGGVNLTSQTCECCSHGGVCACLVRKGKEEVEGEAGKALTSSSGE